MSKEVAISPDQIKTARMKQGLSLSQAAKKWGIAKPTIYSWETGFRKPAGLYLRKIQRILRRLESS